MVKSILYPFLLKNNNNNVNPAAPEGAQKEEPFPENVSVVPAGPQGPWTTPKKGRELVRQFDDFARSINITPTKRLFFSKIRKAYDLKDFDLAAATRKIRSLEA
jgi:hypothetical protein